MSLSEGGGEGEWGGQMERMERGRYKAGRVGVGGVSLEGRYLETCIGTFTMRKFVLLRS